MHPPVTQRKNSRLETLLTGIVDLSGKLIAKTDKRVELWKDWFVYWLGLLTSHSRTQGGWKSRTTVQSGGPRKWSPFTEGMYRQFRLDGDCERREMRSLLCHSNILQCNEIGKQKVKAPFCLLNVAGPFNW